MIQKTNIDEFWDIAYALPEFYVYTPDYDNATFVFSTTPEPYDKLQEFLKTKYKLDYRTSNIIALRTETETAPTMKNFASVLKTDYNDSERVRVLIKFTNVHGKQVIKELRKSDIPVLIDELSKVHNTIPADTALYEDYPKKFLYYNCSDADINDLHTDVQNYINKYCPDWMGTFQITATRPQDTYAVKYNQSHDTKITLGLQIGLLVNNSAVPNVIINSNGYVQFTNITLDTNTINLVSHLNDFFWNKTRYLTFVERNRILNQMLKGDK